MDTTAGITQDTIPGDDDQVIEPWEKTDEALDAAAELMPVCGIEHDGIGEDGQPVEDRDVVEAIVEGAVGGDA
ncbi:hypothetical protein JNW90_01040 [Micromonospora sp. STR1s_5]|nr:hypothetical protein [Micromonospora sp. STR1s_5]